MVHQGEEFVAFVTVVKMNGKDTRATLRISTRPELAVLVASWKEANKIELYAEARKSRSTVLHSAKLDKSDSNELDYQEQYSKLRKMPTRAQINEAIATAKTALNDFIADNAELETRYQLQLAATLKASAERMDF